MRKIIKKILREEIKNTKYLDIIVNKLIDSIRITSSIDYPFFATVGEMYDLGIFTEEADEIKYNKKEYQKLGWDSIVDEDGTYYFLVDDPDTLYSFDEFELEVLSDWFHSLEESGDLIYDDNQQGWRAASRDYLTKSTLVPNFSFPLWYNILHKKYVATGVDNTSNRMSLMRELNSHYGINGSEEFEYIINSFSEKLPHKINELGIELFGRFSSRGNIIESIIDDFIIFGKDELELDDEFKINLTSKNDGLETLGNYDIDKKKINVLTKNRAIPDIIRSIAHEMVHHKQNSEGELSGNQEEGKDGSEWENEANAKAGEMVRKFGRENPEIYDL